jgi:hypothetical protein
MEDWSMIPHVPCNPSASIMPTYARIYCNLNLVKGVSKNLLLIAISSSKDSASSVCSCRYRASSSDSSLRVIRATQGGCCGSPEEYVQKVVLSTLNNDDEDSLGFIDVECAVM